LRRAGELCRLDRGLTPNVGGPECKLHIWRIAGRKFTLHQALGAEFWQHSITSE
jgi:hypothetical protein